MKKVNKSFESFLALPEGKDGTRSKRWQNGSAVFPGIGKTISKILKLLPVLDLVQLLHMRMVGVGQQSFYVTRVPIDERCDRFLLSTSMSSSDTFHASRLVVFPPRVLKRDFTDFFQTRKNLRAVFSRPSPDNPLLHSVLGKVRTTEHPFSERTRRSSSMAVAELSLRL